MAASVNTQKADWITPKEQLKRLATPIFEEVDKIARLIPEMIDIAAEYAMDIRLCSWYIGLERIKKLPDKIPPLPRHIHQIFNAKCPKQICDERKPDGTFYTIGEKCTLTLVPEELGTLNEFEIVVQLYGEKHYPESENPLKFRVFSRSLREKYGNVPFEPTHWELHAHDLIKGSKNKPYSDQIALVTSLSKEVFVDWEVPELHGTVAAVFLKRIATGERLYSAGRDGEPSIYTGVKESAIEGRLNVGGNNSRGVAIYASDPPFNSFGIAVVRKL